MVWGCAQGTKTRSSATESKWVEYSCDEALSRKEYHDLRIHSKIPIICNKSLLQEGVEVIKCVARRWIDTWLTDLYATPSFEFASWLDELCKVAVVGDTKISSISQEHFNRVGQSQKGNKVFMTGRFKSFRLQLMP